ncbi:MAG: hypothetical protein HN877_15800 [Rhodospirillaceae bacterium]|nr:hypothetical protein [Rhodospirillaceae bacterium]
MTTNDYIEFLKRTLQASDAVGEAPILSFQELARHGLDVAGVVAAVSPGCAVIRRKDTIKRVHPDFPELPPGAIAVAIWIVGSDAERADAEWDFFTQGKFIQSRKQTLYQVIRWDDGAPIRRVSAARGADGVVINERLLAEA